MYPSLQIAPQDGCSESFLFEVYKTGFEFKSEFLLQFDVRPNYSPTFLLMDHQMNDYWKEIADSQNLICFNPVFEFSTALY